MEMKKLLVVINLLALFLTSCSTYEIPVVREPSSGESCQDIMKVFVHQEKNQDAMARELKAYLDMNLSLDEVSDFFKEFSEYNPSEREASTFRAIFSYSNGDETVRKSLLKEYHNELSGSPITPGNKVWEKFSAHRKNVETKTKKMIAAGKIEKAKIYEKLYYSCKSQIKARPTPESMRQAKRLTYALTAGGLGSSVITYSAVNWEQEKDAKWFNELYFTLGISLVFTFLSGKFVLANDKLHPWKGKMPLTFLNGALGDIGVSGVYAYFFNASDAEMEKKLKELEKDPKAQERLQEILKVAEEEGLFEKYAKDSENLFRNKKTGEKVALEDIKIEDIDIEASRELLMESIAEKEYQDKSGVLSTGSVAVDRFTYHRIYNIISVPGNIGLSLVMYNQMCMAADPKKGFIKAVGTYMAGSILLDAIYFKGRRELINQ